MLLSAPSLLRVFVVGTLLVAWGVLLSSAHAAAPDSSAVLSGTVQHADRAIPLPQTNVVLRGRDARFATTTDSTGAFRLRVPAGAYRLQVTRVGFAPHAADLMLAPGTSTERTIRLTPQRYVLNEIVVEGGAVRDAQTTTTVQRVDPAALATQDAADVADLGRLIPATHVQTNSRGQTLLYFRNAGERQTAQFFDGALLNVPWDNRVDVSLIPAGVVSSLTVAKGVPPVRYGANVLGGAVNVQSRTQSTPGQTTDLRSEIGSAGQRRAALTHLGRSERWTYAAAVQYDEQGDQPLPDDARVPFSQPDADRRVNTDRQLASGFARGSYHFASGTQVSLTALHVDAERGVAPESHVDPQATRVRYWRYPVWQQSMLIASARVPLGPQTVVRGAAWGNRFVQNIDQYRSVDYQALQETQQDRDHTAGLRLVGTRGLPLGTLTLSANLLTSQHEQTNRLFDTDGEPRPDSVSIYRQHLWSVGGEWDVPLSDRLTVSTGVSLDGTATPDTGPWPARDPMHAVALTLGTEYQVQPGWTLRAAAGRKSRFPTMRERFGAALGKFVPNPSLQPVTAWLAEGGTDVTVGTVQGSATAFFNRTVDTIGKRSRADGREQRINLDGSRVVGMEASARWEAARGREGLTLDGHLTWSRPRGIEAGDTQRLDEKPAWVGTGTATYALPLGLTLMTQLRYTGGTYARTDANTFTRLPEAWLWDARASFALDRWLPGGHAGSVYARVDNLTDAAQFLQLGLPGPGRRVRAGVTLHL